MSGFSEDDIRHAAEIREWLVKQISDKEDEIEKLRITLNLVDSLLKQGSFRAAATLAASFASQPAAAAPSSVQQQTQAPQARSQPARREQQARATSRQAEVVQAQQEAADIRPLKRAKDNLLLANAEVSPGSIEIVPAPGMDLNINTPPFRSFFLNRILEGMKTKDTEKAGKGEISESESLSYNVEEDNGTIKKITINNYRDKERLNEIFNTSSWAFTRMIEKSGK